MDLIYRTGYGNLPAYKDEKLIGILNARKLVTVLGSKVSEGVNLENYIRETSVAEIFQLFPSFFI